MNLTNCEGGTKSGKSRDACKMYLYNVFSLGISRQNSVTCAGQTKVLTAIASVSH